MDNPKSAKVICVASAKGGSGKTGLTATFGTFLSELKQKVLIIDADFSTNGLTLFYLKEVRVNAELVRSKERHPVGLYDALTGNNFSDITELSSYLHLIPATYTLSAENFLADSQTKLRFHTQLSTLRKQYDFILIDAQAGADDIAQIAISRKISDEVVIVSEYDPMSAAGVERLKALFREDLTYDRTWVLLNKILPEFAQTFGDFLEVAKYLNPIPWDAEVVRAYARRRLAINSETGSEYTLTILQTLKSLCGELIQEQISEWISSRAAVIRQPIEQQYADAEKEMEYLFLRKNHISRTAQIFKLSAFIVAVVFASSGIYLTEYANFRVPPEFVMVAMGAASVFAAIAVFANPNEFLQLFGTSIKSQVDEARYERQMELVAEKLKRLELLRTLDAETLIQRRDLTLLDNSDLTRIKNKR